MFSLCLEYLPSLQQTSGFWTKVSENNKISTVRDENNKEEVYFGNKEDQLL